MPFSPEEAACCQRLVDLAIAEDLGALGDITSQGVIPEGCVGRAMFVARREGVLAGLPALPLVLQAVDARLTLELLAQDGRSLKVGDRIAVMSGPMRSILAAERTALNFLQHLSGIATLTRRHVDAVAELPCKILDTRKTLPGWRLLAKYAVRQGGGVNHRRGLFDAILIKDNHWFALGSAHFPEADIVERVVREARQRFPNAFVEIEVDDLVQFDGVLALQPNAVLLDNMTTADMREAVRRRQERAPHVQLEASGGVTLDTVRAIAATGVDRISVGALTHSAPALDIALDYIPSPLSKTAE